MNNELGNLKTVHAAFFLTGGGRQPVREWLLNLDKDDRKVIGEAIKTAEYGWPIGMPLIRKLEADLWEIRVKLSRGRLARVMFTVDDDQMLLLHAFLKTTQKTPQVELETARKRLTMAKS